MAWVILGLGLALCVSGAAALWSGVSYMPVEWGWSQIIAGATVISGGVVTIGLAAVVHRLRGLQIAMLRLAVPQFAADELAPEADEEAETPGLADLPEPSSERTARGPSSRAILVPPPAAADDVTAGSNGHGRRVGIGDVVGLVSPPPEPDLTEPVSAPLPSERAEGGAEQAYAGDAGVLAPADADGAERTVVGRYEAGGASYALFSDGTIEVETEAGTHRFGSMDELKDFLERQDRANQADWPE